MTLSLGRPAFMPRAGRPGGRDADSQRHPLVTAVHDGVPEVPEAGGGGERRGRCRASAAHCVARAPTVRRCCLGCCELQATVRPPAVGVVHVDTENSFEVPPDEYEVQSRLSLRTVRTTAPRRRLPEEP